MTILKIPQYQLIAPEELDCGYPHTDIRPLRSLILNCTPKVGRKTFGVHYV